MRLWRTRSIRFRLTSWYAGVLALILTLYAMGIFFFLRHSLFTELDLRLREDFELAEDMLGRNPEGSVHWRAGHHHDAEETVSPGYGRLVEVWSPEGTFLYRNSSKAELRFVQANDPLKQSIPESLRAADGARVRVLSAQHPVGGLPAVIRVGRSEEPIRHELRELLLGMGLALPLGVTLAGLGGYLLARSALAPVSEMTQRARRIRAERLNERLPVENPDDELGHLADVFNETFARLEQSFRQLRLFTADASHELRTPLTAIRSVGEVALREQRSPESYREVIGSMLEEADRLGRLVDSLLTLSRADAGQIRLSPEPVDLVELIREVVSHLGVLAEEKRQVIHVEADNPLEVSLDRIVFRQAMINLLDNAIKYSPERACIRIVVCEREQQATIDVIDQGHGIPPEHIGEVFERFYRVDTARSRELGGAGLGLSIARWAVEAHGGRIEVESQEGFGSTFRIVLPA